MNLLSKQTNPDTVHAKGIVNITAGLSSEKYVKVDENGNKTKIDPLNNAAEFANKPASSIPTMFARVLFFNSALLNIDDINSRQKTVYAATVSQWLDLLELIFRKGTRLRFEAWNVQEQIDALKKSGEKGNKKHKLLAEAFEAHKKYLPGVSTLYLIFDEKGNLMGGTSPYTFVYTAPNYNSNLPTRSLLEREKDFQDFMVRLYLMLEATGALEDRFSKLQFTGFVSYMKEVLKDRQIKERFPDTDSTTKYSYEAFEEIYSDIKNKENSSIVVGRVQGQENGAPKTFQLHLYMRKEGALTTDFYIKSNVQKFDPEETPLALPVPKDSNYEGRILHDNVEWTTSITYLQDESATYKDKERDLPDNSGVRHAWLSEVNFLEDKLVQLPYLVDTSKFFGALNVPTDKPDGSSVSYLLPIKPVLLRFFTVEKIKEIVTFKKDEKDDKKINVSLRIPTCNLEGQDTGCVEYKKTYTLPASIYSLSGSQAVKDVLSVGISPFVRYAEPNLGLNNDKKNNDDEQKPIIIDDHYHVMLQASNIGKNRDVTLSFLTVGNGEIAELNAQPAERLSEPNNALKRFARFYDVRKPFEAIEVQVKNDGNQVGGGLIIPIWNTIENKDNKLYLYSIDFGTTNTHMAYISFKDKEIKSIESVTSFKMQEIKDQVQYLAGFPVQAKQNDETIKLKNFLTHIYGKQLGKIILEDQARLFYPNFLSKEYSFPIRTVVTQSNGNVEDDAKIFKSVSIGFFNSKEVSKRVSSKYNYNNDLKWNLETNIGVGPAKTIAKLFFIQLLDMARSHWMQQQDADLTQLPRFVITYPLSMSNVPGVINIWKEAYQAVFGVAPAKDSFITVAESLAPAYKLIDAGALKSAGLLNVDIGGGTTDLQYFCEYNGKVVSKYDSVRFAGDDLWGVGNENVPDAPKAQDNVFTRFADDRLASTNLKLNADDSISYSQIDFTGKEKINMLLRDESQAFYDALTKDKEHVAFKAIQVHYAALIYYIANWILSDEEMSEIFPKTLNFSGFGSKYISFLFGDEPNPEECLTNYTKSLLKAFGVENVPDDFVVKFSENPKDVTAEGAVIIGQKTVNGDKVTRPKTWTHLGYEGYAKGERLSWRDISTSEMQEKAKNHFEDFINKFQTVYGEDITPLPNTVLTRFKRHASRSFDEMLGYMKPKNDVDGQGLIKNSIFFWMLKGSIHNFDQD